MSTIGRTAVVDTGSRELLCMACGQASLESKTHEEPGTKITHKLGVVCAASPGDSTVRDLATGEVLDTIHHQHCVCDRCNTALHIGTPAWAVASYMPGQVPEEGWESGYISLITEQHDRIW